MWHARAVRLACFLLFLVLPILAIGVPLFHTARSRWRSGALPLLIAAPFSVLALLGLPFWSPFGPDAFAAVIGALAACSAAIVLFVACRAAFRDASAEVDDLERQDRLERTAMAFLGGGVMDLLYTTILGLASWLTHSTD